MQQHYYEGLLQPKVVPYKTILTQIESVTVLLAEVIVSS